MAKKLQLKPDLSAHGVDTLDKLQQNIEEVKDKLRPLERCMQLKKNAAGDALTAADCTCVASM